MPAVINNHDFSGQLGAQMFHALAGCVDHDSPTFPPGLEERFMSAIRGSIERHGDTLTFTSADAKLTYQRVGDVADHIDHSR